MKMNKSYIIVAFDEQTGFGKDGKIPWHYPRDLKHFKNTTSGAALVMGRKTYEDILSYMKNNKFLPDRKCVVITSSNDESPWDNVTFVKSTEDAMKTFEDFEGNVFFIGGERVFESALNIVDGVYVTLIPGNHDCDKFFPIGTLLENFALSDVEVDIETELIFSKFERKE